MLRVPNAAPLCGKMFAHTCFGDDTLQEAHDDGGSLALMRFARVFWKCNVSNQR